MFTELDAEEWPIVTATSAVIQGKDPLQEIDDGG